MTFDGRTKTMGTTRDMGISCSVMTRDIGVCHSGPKQCSVSTNTNLPPSRSFSELVICEAMKENVPLIPPHSVKEDMVSLKSLINKSEVKTTSTTTDLQMNQIYSDMDLDRHIDKAIKMYEKTVHQELQLKKKENITMHNKCSQTILQETLNIIEKKDSEIQTEFEKHYVSIDKTIKENMCDAETQDTLDSLVKYRLCEKCSKEKVNVSVGVSFEDLPNDSLSLRTMGLTRNRSFDYGDRSPFTSRKTINTRSVACGAIKWLTDTKGTDTIDLHVRHKDVGMNTIKRHLIDVAVGDSIHFKPSSSTICDKCASELNSVAIDPLLSGKGEKICASANSSRIPRPTNVAQVSIAPTFPTHSPEKRKLIKQDTNAKITADIHLEKMQSPDTSIHLQ